MAINTLLDNPADMLKQMEDEANKAAAEEGVVDNTVDDKVAKAIETKEDTTDEADTKAVDDSGAGAKAGEDDPDEAEEALSDDPKKRGNAFGKMRHEAKELKAQLDKERGERQAMAERLAKLEGRAEATPKVEAKDTDPEPDSLMYPEDHNAWQIRKLKGQLEDISKTSKETQQYQQYQYEVQGMNKLDQQYKAGNPKVDFDGAVNYLVEKERTAKKLMNPTLNDAQINAQIEVERVSLYRNLVNSGRNPSEVLHQLAKSHGFVEGKPAATTEKKVDLKAVENNQRRASNLIGGSPASKDNGKLTSEAVLEMGFQQMLRGSRKNPNMFETEER